MTESQQCFYCDFRMMVPIDYKENTTSHMAMMPHGSYGFLRLPHLFVQEVIYGSPICSCPSCSKETYAKSIKEPALHGIKNEMEDNFYRRFRVLVIIFGVLTPFFSILSLYTLLFSKTKPVSLLLIGPFILFLFFMSLKRLKEFKYRYNVILSETLVQKQKAYDASLERLKNIDYVRKLAVYEPKAKQLLNELEQGRPGTYAKRPEQAEA